MMGAACFASPCSLNGCAREQEAYASTKQEEDRANAKRREATAAEEAVKTAKAASDYKKWRGGDN